MLVKDHIKFFGQSPVRGQNLEEFGTRFFDMTNAYPEKLRAIALKCAEENNIKLVEGVYSFMPGPQFETPAEIRMMEMLGADAVGMSTVSEVIVAVQCGIECLCISCITNLAAGVGQGLVSDEEVVETAGKVSNDFARLVISVVNEINYCAEEV